MEELLEEGAAGQPHPCASIHAPVHIQQELIKHLAKTDIQTALFDALI